MVNFHILFLATYLGLGAAGGPLISDNRPEIYGGSESNVAHLLSIHPALSPGRNRGYESDIFRIRSQSDVGAAKNVRLRSYP